jgi:hypothetical protein
MFEHMGEQDEPLVAAGRQFGKKSLLNLDVQFLARVTRKAFARLDAPRLAAGQFQLFHGAAET